MASTDKIPQGENLKAFFSARGIDIESLMEEAERKVTEHSKTALAEKSRETRVSFSDIIIEETLRNLLVNAYNLANRGVRGADLTRMILAKRNITLKFIESMRMQGPKSRYRGRSVKARRETDIIHPRGSDMRGLPDSKDARESMIAGMPAPEIGTVHADTLRKIRTILTDREWVVFKSRLRGEKDTAAAARIGLSESSVTLIYQRAREKILKQLPELQVHRRAPSIQPNRRRRHR